MNNWVDLIQSLISFRREIGYPIDDIFLPGLSREYILEKTLNYPFYFPDENGYDIEGNLEYRIGYKYNPEITTWKYEPFTVENSNIKTGYQFSSGAVFGIAIILIFVFSGLPIDLNYIQIGMGLTLIILCGLMAIIWSEIITGIFR